MKANRLAAYILAIVMLFSCCSTLAFAQNDGIKLYIDNVEQELKNPIVDDNGVLYVPMQEVLFKMGIYMEWNDMEKCWLGEGNNGEIRFIVGDWKADIDWVDVEMPGPVKEINGVVMIPAFILEDAAKIAPPVYDEATKSLYVEYPDINYKPEEEFKLEAAVPYFPTPTPEMDMFDEEYLYNLQGDNGAANIVYDVVEVEGMPFKKAAQLETLPMNPVPLTDYSVQMHVITNKGDFLSGDVGYGSFWARATNITDESGVARFGMVYEQTQTWHKAASYRYNLTSEWQKFYFPLFSGLHSLYAGKSHVTFIVGYKAQTIQIADVHLYNYKDQLTLEQVDPGKTQSYKGIEEDALWRKEANKRVEKYRKNDMLVNVVDENGNPIEGATVKADLEQNEFMWGIAICRNEVVDLEEESRRDKALLDATDTFNGGVCGLEMKAYRHIDDYQEAARMINMFLSKGMKTRGHALIWDDMKVREYPEYASRDVANWDEAKLAKAQELLKEECAAELWMFKGTIDEWDGMNEPHDSSKWRKAHGTETFSEIFQMAKALDPKSTVIVNETGIEGRSSRTTGTRARALRGIVDPMVDEERAPVDGLGVQAHCANYHYPQGFYQDLRILVEDGKYDTCSVTEYDFYNTNYEWAPEHLRDTMLATYSFPKASVFVMWGFQDAMHWRGYAPLLDRKFYRKEEYDMWEKMVNEVFSTHETTTTDENGNAVIRGHRGKYLVEVEANGVKDTIEFTLTNSDNTERDNKIEVVLKGGKLHMSTSNPWETYAENNSPNGKVDFYNMTEALADYKEFTANRELIGIYWHSDSDGNRVPRVGDGLYNTFNYVDDGEHLQFELVKKADKGTISVDFRAPKGEVYDYKILTSVDGKEYKEIYAGSSAQKVEIPYENAMFFRVVNDGNEYMGVSEVNIYAEKKK